jgi:hypothetical protein
MHLFLSISFQKILDFPSTDEQFHKCRIRLLSPGLPIFNEIDGTELGMCVPVRPTTANPLSRTPLRTSRMLPWTKCYHHSALSIVLRISLSLDEEKQTLTCVDPDDMFEHDFVIQEDEERRKMLRQMRWQATSNTPQYPHSIPNYSDPAPPEYGLLDETDSVGTLPAHLPLDPGRILQSDLAPLYTELFDNANQLELEDLPNTTPRACAHYSLCLAEILNDPVELLAEVASL